MKSRNSPHDPVTTLSRNLPVVVLSGSAIERGRQHGTLFNSQIRASIDALRVRYGAASYTVASQRAATSWPLIRQHAETAAEEIDGIAEGAGCEPIDILLHIGFEFSTRFPHQDVAGVALARPDGAIIGQNWDAPTDMAATLALFIHIDVDGSVDAYVASHGMLGWVGINRYGLALLTNDLMLDTTPAGLPSQIVRRVALNHMSVDGALSILSRLPHMGGRCYLLGDAAGRIAGVEISPSAGVQRLPKDRLVLHTNHALSPACAATEYAQLLQATYPSSRRRYDRLCGLADGANTLTDVMAVLRDREGAPNAISKTPSDEEPTETAFSIIFDCAARSLRICAGPPAAGLYTTVHLSDPSLACRAATRVVDPALCPAKP